MAMTFDDIVRNRWSVRAYDPRPVRREDLLALCEAARQAPSACNSQTWRFIVVTDRKALDRLCDEAMRAVFSNGWLRQAPAVIVGCSRLDLVSNRIGTAITGIEYFQIDLGIAMEHIALKAVDLGLGTCWIGWFQEDKVKEILRIPKGVRVTALLSVGYPRSPSPPPRRRKPIEEIAYSETWEGAFSDLPSSGKR